jgi:hypothetical protein
MELVDETEEGISQDTEGSQDVLRKVLFYKGQAS